MERIRLLSLVFRSNKGLSKEVNQKRERRCTETPKGFQEEESYSETYRMFQEGEEDPCTSYPQK